MVEHQPTKTSSTEVPATTKKPCTVAQPPTPAEIRPGTILSPARRDPFERIAAYLRRLAKERFYGIVSVTLRDGVVQVVRTDQTLKLSDIPTTATPGDTATALGTTTATGGVA
jgi:uncharacterized membrane protein